MSECGWCGRELQGGCSGPEGSDVCYDGTDCRKHMSERLDAAAGAALRRAGALGTLTAERDALQERLDVAADFAKQREEMLKSLTAERDSMRAVVEALGAQLEDDDHCRICDYDEITAKGHQDGCALHAFDLR